MSQPIILTEITPTIKPKTKPTTKRFFMLFLVCLITFVNYLDRTNLSVAAPMLSKDLALSPATMGLVFSTFGWTYTCMQIPSGWFLDRFGPRLVYGVSLLGWSIFSALTSCVNGLGSMMGCRLGLGIFEAPAFPANGRIVTAWFPSNERGLAIGAYTGAEYIGLAFCTPFLTWMLVMWGWRSVFIFTGILGVIASIGWFASYRDPAHCKGVNKAELDLIKEGGGLSDTVAEQTKITWKDIKYLICQRQIIGMCIGGFAVSSTLFFFLTWFPSYLVNAKHMPMLKVGIYAAIPYIAAIIGVLVSGKWSDWMVNKGSGLGMSRKLPVIVGLLLSCLIMGANYTNNINIIISFMAIAFFGQGMASTISWALLSDIAPKELVGLCGGTYNFVANMGGTLAPLIIGLIINQAKSYTPALIYVSIIALIGALAYIFVIGKPHRIEITV